MLRYGSHCPVYWRTTLVALVGLTFLGLGTVGMGRMLAATPSPGGFTFSPGDCPNGTDGHIYTSDPVQYKCSDPPLVTGITSTEPQMIGWATALSAPAEPWLTISAECPEGTSYNIMQGLPPNTVCVIHLRSSNRLMVDHPATYFKSGGSEVTLQFTTEER